VVVVELRPNHVSSNIYICFVFVILVGLSALYVPPDQGEATEDADDGRRMRKRSRMLQELNGLIEDNAGKSERDRTIIWRKIQKYLARTDDIANE
jgi:hypothetical protein